MAELTERLGFNLADTFSCYIKFLTNFLQCSGTSVIQAETESQYFLFSLCQCSKYFI